MKQTLIFFLSLAVFYCTSAQSFEGRILYKNSYKSKTANVTDAQFTSMLGDTLEYFIKKGHYKSLVNGTFLQSQFYINSENRLYTKMTNNESFLWNDGADNPVEIVKVDFNKSVITILGYLCDELIFTTKSGSEKYYFNIILGVDPGYFIKHKYGNWYEYLSRSKALTLKTIFENDNFIMESTAIELKAMKLEDSVFSLPANAKIAKNTN